MKTGKVICNVGYFQGFGEATIFTAFLVKMSNGEEHIAILKPAETILGTPYVKGLCWLPREKFLPGSKDTHNIPASIVARLALNTEIALADETEYANRFKASVFATETAILALTTTAFGITTIGGVPPTYTIIGANTSVETVNALKEEIGLDEPVNNGTNTSGGLILTANATAYPTLTGNPIEAAKAAFGNPIEYAKANPISAAVMGVGIVEIGHQLGFWKFSVLKSVGILKKGKR